MHSKKIDIKLTMHARNKILERNIIIEQIKEVILNYEKSETDKFDSSLVHLIKKMDNKFLRVIGKWESGLVVDYNEKGNIVGLEIISFSKKVSQSSDIRSFAI